MFSHVMRQWHARYFGRTCFVSQEYFVSRNALITEADGCNEESKKFQKRVEAFRTGHGALRASRDIFRQTEIPEVTGIEP